MVLLELLSFTGCSSNSKFQGMWSRLRLIYVSVMLGAQLVKETESASEMWCFNYVVETASYLCVRNVRCSAGEGKGVG
jgi:hypothetical protein